jgi:hypothetical protein
MTKFPTAEWDEILKHKVNSDEHGAQIAKNWEGDICTILDFMRYCQEETTSIL